MSATTVCDAPCAPVLHVHTARILGRPPAPREIESWRSTWREATTDEALFWAIGAGGR